MVSPFFFPFFLWLTGKPPPAPPSPGMIIIISADKLVLVSYRYTLLKALCLLELGKLIVVRSGDIGTACIN